MTKSYMIESLSSKLESRSLRSVCVLMKIALVACSLLLLCLSCRSPQVKLDKLLQDHPELVQVRPLTITDSVYLPGASIKQHIDLSDTIDSLTITDVPGVVVTFKGSAKGDLTIERLPETIPFTKVLNLPTIGVSLMGAPTSGVVYSDRSDKVTTFSTVDKVIIAASLLLILFLMFYKK